MAHILGYLHVSLTVTDLARSAAWYQQVLGFTIDAETNGQGFRRTRLRAPDSGIGLALTCHDEGSGGRFSELRTGMDHLAFRVEGVEGVEAVRLRCEEFDVDCSEVKVSDGIARMTLRDPANIQLEVFERPGLDE